MGTSGISEERVALFWIEVMVEVCSPYRKLTARHGACPRTKQNQGVKFPSETPILYIFLITAHSAIYVYEYMNYSYD